MDSADPQPLDSILIWHLSASFVLCVFRTRRVCSALSPWKAFWGESRRLREWVIEGVSELTCCRAPRQAARCVSRAAWPSACRQTPPGPKSDGSPATPEGQQGQNAESPTHQSQSGGDPPPRAAQTKRTGSVSQPVSDQHDLQETSWPRLCFRSCFWRGHIMQRSLDQRFLAVNNASAASSPRPLHHHFLYCVRFFVNL